MKTEKIFYCVSKVFPVFYKVDPREGIIESIKNWNEYPKVIDRFEYSAVFATELKRTCKSITADEYEQMREFVAAYNSLSYPTNTKNKSTDNQISKPNQNNEK